MLRLSKHGVGFFNELLLNQTQRLFQEDAGRTLARLVRITFGPPRAARDILP